MSSAFNLSHDLTALLSTDYLSLFDLPMDYDIDMTSLTGKYLNWQKLMHPDMAAGDEQKQRVLMQGAAYINEAFEILVSPFKRAEYMLSLHFRKDMNFAGTTLKDTEFLVEQMSLREDLQRIKTLENPLTELAKMSSDCNSKLKSIETDFASLWRARRQDDSFKHEAVLLIQKMLFFIKLTQEAEELEAQMLDVL